MISIQSNFTYFDGAIYGVPSSVLVGKMTVLNNVSFNTSTLDKLLEESFLFDIYSQKENRLDKPLTQEDDILILAKKLLYWYTQIHQITDMPISKKTYISLVSEKKNSNIYTIAFQSFVPKVSIKVLKFLLFIFNTMLNDKEQKNIGKKIFDFLASLKPFSLPGTNNKHFIHAILELEIPYKLISNRILLLGQGIHMKKMLSSSTDNTSVVGVNIAANKSFSFELLKVNGFPTAAQLPAHTLETTLIHAKKLGYPVVLKPANEEQGRGVSSNIKNEKELIQIYNETNKEYKNLLLEKHIFGEDYRFTVVNGKVVNIFKRIAGGVIGDGKSTIKELVVNLQEEDYYKSKYMQKGKHLISLDKEARTLLNKQNYTEDTVLEKDIYVPIRRQNNVSTGGRLIGIENENVHPDNLDLAIKVAELFHLNMAGIDFISNDITTSWLEENTKICEVNAVPELGFSAKITLSKEIIQDFMKDGSRIPVHLIVVESQTIQDKKFHDNIFKNSKYKNYSIANNVIINGKIFTNKMENSFYGLQVLLMNEKVDEAYCFIAVDKVQKYGLPADWFEEIIFTTSIDNELSEKIKPHTDTIVFSKVEDII